MKKKYKMNDIVILGSGIGGQVISYGLKKNFPNLNITLIGPKQYQVPGLFYLESPIEDIFTRTVEVEYDKVGEGTFEDYQRKSRGFNLNFDEIKISSFNLISKKVTGYACSSTIDLSGVVQIFELVNKVDFNRQVVVTDNHQIKFDKLISTIPLNNFLPLCGKVTDNIKKEFKFSPIYQTIVGSDNFTFDKIKVYYNLNQDTPIYRMTSYYKNDEITRIVSESLVETNLDCETKLVPGKIIPSQSISLLVNLYEEMYPIKFCGRYARWDYHYLINQSYDDAFNFIKENKF